MECMGCILDCNDLLLEKIPQRESKIQVHRDMECVFSTFYCSYLLLFGRESNTVPQGFGMYFGL